MYLLKVIGSWLAGDLHTYKNVQLVKDHISSLMDMISVVWSLNDKCTNLTFLGSQTVDFDMVTCNFQKK